MLDLLDYKGSLSILMYENSVPKDLSVLQLGVVFLNSSSLATIDLTESTKVFDLKVDSSPFVELIVEANRTRAAILGQGVAFTFYPNESLSLDFSLAYPMQLCMTLKNQLVMKQI